MSATLTTMKKGN